MTTLIDPRDPLQIEFVVDLLKQKKPVALPSETVYGLAALAHEEKALARIFELKARPHFDPLIVHVLDYERAKPWIQGASPLHEKLCKRFWPGPLTLLFHKSSRIPDLCTAGSEWVALRSPSHADFRKVLEKIAPAALAAPSANRFASISPTTSVDVIKELGPHGLEAVVEGGACEHGLESTVLKIHSEAEVEIVRPGALPAEMLREFLGPGVNVKVRDSGSGAIESESSHEAPGQHRIHYAPSKPLYFVAPNGLAALLKEKNLHPSQGALLEIFPANPPGLSKSSWAKSVCLSKNRSWTEAAAALFSDLRALDGEPSVEFIVALEGSTESLGLAISDRLRRASAKSR